MGKLRKKLLTGFLFILALVVLSSCTKKNTLVLEPSIADMENKLKEKK